MNQMCNICAQFKKKRCCIASVAKLSLGLGMFRFKQLTYNGDVSLITSQPKLCFVSRVCMICQDKCVVYLASA